MERRKVGLPGHVDRPRAANGASLADRVRTRPWTWRDDCIVSLHKGKIACGTEGPDLEVGDVGAEEQAAIAVADENPETLSVMKISVGSILPGSFYPVKMELKDGPPRYFYLHRDSLALEQLFTINIQIGLRHLAPPVDVTPVNGPNGLEFRW